MIVAFVIPSLQRPSGWRTYSVASIRALARLVEPVLFAPAAFAAEARDLFPAVPVFALPVTQQASLATVIGQARLASCWTAVQAQRWPVQVDLVHSLEAYPTGLVGSWLGRKFHCPHVLSPLGTYGVVWADHTLDRRAYAQVLRTAALVCPISAGTRQLLEQHFGAALAHGRLQTILIGNDFTRKVSPEISQGRRPQLIPTLLSVGDVKPRKGQHISLAAFAHLKRRLPQARYRIVGSYNPQSAYFQQLQQLIDQQGIQDVAFLGTVSDADLHRFYQEASVFVLTPQQVGLHFEGFGLVYLEAGAYGLPVVAARTGGVPDVVRDGETGLLASQDDIEGLAGALYRLLTEPDLARRMGLANRRWAETLTWERYAQEQAQAYRQILTAGSREEDKQP